MLFENYVADRLKAINDSVSRFIGGSVARKSYSELLGEIKGNVKKEERTADEIIASISEKLERIGNGSI